MAENHPDRQDAARYGPLLCYVILLGLVYGAYRWHAPRDTQRVVITRARIDARVAGETELRGAPPTPAGRRALVDLLVEEEVLLREAERRRLHRDDPLIRQALLGGITTELGGNVAAPTDEEVRAHYAARPERYALPPTITIEQAVFSNDAALPPSDEVLAALRGGKPPESYATVYGISARAGGLSRAELVQVYGIDFAEAVLAIESADWHGPIVSTLATHYVRVTERRSSTPRPFEDVRSYVREDLLWERTGAAISEQLADLRARYDVRVGRSTR